MQMQQSISLQRNIARQQLTESGFYHEQLHRGAHSEGHGHQSQHDLVKRHPVHDFPSQLFFSLRKSQSNQSTKREVDIFDEEIDAGYFSRKSGKKEKKTEVGGG
jgi:hypothetical protein